MKKDILKRVIINGSTGSSCLFKRFNKLQVIVTDKSKLKDILEKFFFFSKILSIDFIQFGAIDESHKIK